MDELRGLTRTDGEPLPDDVEERLLELFAGGHPPSDEPTTEEEERAITARVQAGMRLTPEDEAEIDRLFPQFSEAN